MKFNCDPKVLSEALNVVSKALSTRFNVPILEGIKILVEKDSVTLIASDMEIFIEKKIVADVDIQGEAVVIGKIFTEFVRRLVDFEKITIEKIGENINIHYGENETFIQCLNAGTYPKVIPFDEDNNFEVKESDLKDTLESALFCVAVDDSKPILKGCLIEVIDDMLTIVALDGYRLAMTKCKTKAQSNHIKIVVPGKTISEVAKTIKEADATVKVYIQKNNVIFCLDHALITLRLINGDFIQYEKIIPANFTTNVRINKMKLMNGIDRAALIVKTEKESCLKLSIANNEVLIKSSSTRGNFRESIPCQISGKNIDIAFNGKYLMDALGKIKDDSVQINFKENTIASINPISGNKFAYIILPMRC